MPDLGIRVEDGTWSGKAMAADEQQHASSHPLMHPVGRLFVADLCLESYFQVNAAPSTLRLPFILRVWQACQLSHCSAGVQRLA